jgi:hypothetical protein
VSSLRVSLGFGERLEREVSLTKPERELAKGPDVGNADSPSGSDEKSNQFGTSVYSP